MSGIYGDMLLAFPEQLQSISIFAMDAKVTGGWTIDNTRQFDVRGVFHHTGGKQLKENGGRQRMAFDRHNILHP